MRSRLVSGGLLIVLGLLFLALNRFDAGAEIVVALLGTGFLVWFAFTENYGLLIAGAVLTGLGLGIVWETAQPMDGAPVLLGLGGGFLGILAIDRLIGNHRPGWWWPAIPGGILSFLGFFVAFEATRYWVIFVRWWPAILVLVGLWLLRGRGRRPQQSHEGR